jgi:hypothetical protein
MVKSDTRPEEVQFLQGKKLINFDIKEVEVKDEMKGEPRVGFEYNQVAVNVSATRADIIEAIISVKYSAGAEIALTNDRAEKADEYAEYQAYRVEAKVIADRVK